MNKGKKTIEYLRALKSIKADDGFKFDLRKKIIEESGDVTKLYTSRLKKQQDMSILQVIKNNLLKNKNMLIPLLLIVGLLGGGAGATYASQSALPGDALYIVKLATEKAQTVLVVNNEKEADLHLKFSSKRLEEVEKLAHKGKKSPELVKLAVDNYKNELAQAQTILNSVPANTAEATQIAQNVSDAVAQSKVVMVRVSKEFDEDNDLLHILEEAWEEAIEHGDMATIALLQNAINNVSENSSSATQDSSDDQAATQTTSSTTIATVIDSAMQAKVLNKIAEANHKIVEAEKYITKKEAKNVDTTGAKAQIAIAKTIVADAQNLLNQNKYSEAFLKAKEAHKSAEAAKKLAENKSKKEKHDDDDDDEYYKMIFIIPAATDYTTTSNDTTNTSSTNNTSSTVDAVSSAENTATDTSTTSTQTITPTDYDDDEDEDEEDHDDKEDHDEEDDEDDDDKDEDKKRDRD